MSRRTRLKFANRASFGGDAGKENGKERKKERHCDKSSRSTGIEHSRGRFSHTWHEPIRGPNSVGNPETSANPTTLHDDR